MKKEHKEHNGCFTDTQIDRLKNENPDFKKEQIARLQQAKDERTLERIEKQREKRYNEGNR